MDSRYELVGGIKPHRIETRFTFLEVKVNIAVT
jgi:hypothetical protein